MANRDYYDILGVTRQASQDQIKSSYRKLAIKYHPDKNRGDAKAEDSFKEATEAYEVLSDTQKRSRYDQFGKAGVNASGSSSYGTKAYSDFSDIFGDVGDVFSDFLEADLEEDRAQGVEAQIYVIILISLWKIALWVKKLRFKYLVKKLVMLAKEKVVPLIQVVLIVVHAMA